jgi:hypothetical protein
METVRNDQERIADIGESVTDPKREEALSDERRALIWREVLKTSPLAVGFGPTAEHVLAYARAIEAAVLPDGHVAIDKAVFDQMVFTLGQSAMRQTGQSKDAEIEKLTKQSAPGGSRIEGE